MLPKELDSVAGGGVVDDELLLGIQHADHLVQTLVLALYSNIIILGYFITQRRLFTSGQGLYILQNPMVLGGRSSACGKNEKFRCGGKNLNRRGKWD